jgi:hypothetical protein
LLNTDILRWRPDGSIAVDTGGFATMTTRRRMNERLPDEVRVDGGGRRGLNLITASGRSLKFERRVDLLPDGAGGWEARLPGAAAPRRPPRAGDEVVWAGGDFDGDEPANGDYGVVEATGPDGLVATFSGRRTTLPAARARLAVRVEDLGPWLTDGLFAGDAPANLVVFDTGEAGSRYLVAYTGHIPGLEGEGRRRRYPYREMSEAPRHPPGVGLSGEWQRPFGGRGPSALGRRIPFSALPPDCRRLALDDYCDWWDLPKPWRLEPEHAERVYGAAAADLQAGPAAPRP